MDIIWTSLVESKFKEIYIGHKIIQLKKFERNINIFLILSTSGSIASWMIWENLKLIWAIIIGISQVVSLIKPYFPYSENIKELKKFNSLYKKLNLKYEKLWNQISTGTIEEEEAMNDYFQLRDEENEFSDLSDEIIISNSDKIYNKSNSDLQHFLKNNYKTD
jgi:phosphoribosylpyrophosphate synthetase